MSITNQKVFAWCGPLMIVLWLGGFLIFSQFVPPPSPGDSAQEIADIYADRTNSIRFGLLLTLAGSTLLGPFVTAIFMQMRRIEGRSAPLAYLQLVLGACLVLEFLIPVLVLQAAAYRADRSAEAVQTLNDVGWFIFIGLPSTAVLQLLIIGIAILQDRRRDPIFPRWSGYLTIWVGFTFSPAALCVFFKDGPLAWDGVFSWWVPVGCFGPWIGVMTMLMVKALNRQQAEPDDDRVPEESLVVTMQQRIDQLEAEFADLRSAQLSGGSTRS